MRQVHGAVRISTDAAFTPFIEFIESLGVEIGSFDAAIATPDAPADRRLYCVAFENPADVLDFAVAYGNAMAEREDLRPVAELVGPGFGVMAGDVCLLFWPGLYGDAVTTH